MKVSSFLVLLTFSVSLSACAANSQYQSEFAGMSGVNSVGNTQTAYMTNDELKQAIDKAYLEGELTAEQARKAHMQLDVKGHLTAEQIAVINRDRLAQRHKYETNKENLDVYRDVTQTGSSMLSDVYNIKNTVGAIFR